MIETIITIEKLNGHYIARPEGQLGTMGWYPFPWGITKGRTADIAFWEFSNKHPKTQLNFKFIKQVK